MPRKKKRPGDMTTDEALEHLFPGSLADALREAISDEDEEQENEATDEP